MALTGHTFWNYSLRICLTIAFDSLAFTSVSRAEDNPPELPVLNITKAHGEYVSAVTFSKNGHVAASSDMKGSVLLWNVQDVLMPKGEFRATSGPGVEKWVWSVALSVDGKFLAAGSDDKTVWIWETESGKLQRRVRGHDERVDHVFFLPDGKKGVSLDQYGGCLIWDIAGDAEPRKLKAGARGSTALSSDGKLLCFSDGNETALFALVGAKKLGTLGKYCDGVAFSHDGKRVAKGNNSFPKSVELWDIKSNKPIWSSKGHNNQIKGVLFTPESTRIVSMDGVRLHVWETQTGDEIARFRIGGTTVATCIACAPDGKKVLIGDREGRLTLHKLPD